MSVEDIKTKVSDVADRLKALTAELQQGIADLKADAADAKATVTDALDRLTALAAAVRAEIDRLDEVDEDEGTDEPAPEQQPVEGVSGAEPGA